MGLETTLFRITLWVIGWSVCHDNCILLLDTILSLVTSSYYTPNGLRDRLQGVKTGRRHPCISLLLHVYWYTGNTARRANLKRLIRSIVYCIIATISGAYVIWTEYSSWPMDLLHHWSLSNTLLFEMAIGHWLFSIVEDVAVKEHAISHLIVDFDERDSLFGSMLSKLLAHHVITIFAYAWCLFSHYLSGLCVFGLLFEAPVIVLAYRDICACFEEEFDFPLAKSSPHRVQLMWYIMYTLWHIGRSLPCALYPISLLVWREQLVTVPIGSRVVYHILGLMYIYINITLLYTVIPRMVIEDMIRTTTLSYSERLERLRCLRSGREPIRSTDTNSQSYAEKGATGESKAHMLIGAKELSTHCSEDDIWVTIEGRVYDLTPFLNSHPGGASVLLRCAGTDATEKFLSVGHSQNARSMMEQYRVGNILLRGYEQSSDLRSHNTLLGDTSAPYELGKVYLRVYDPITFLMIAPTICLTLQYLACKSPTYPSALGVVGGPIVLASSMLLSSTFCCVLWKYLPQLVSTFPTTVSRWLTTTQPIHWNTVPSLLLRMSTHVCAVTLLAHIVAEFWLLVVSVRDGEGLRPLRASLLCSFALEFTYRKLFVHSPHTRITNPYASSLGNALYKYVPCLALMGAAALDISCIAQHDFARETLVIAEWDVGAVVGIVMVAVLRVVAVRCIYPRASQPLEPFTLAISVLVLATVYGCFLSLPYISGILDDVTTSDRLVSWAFLGVVGSACFLNMALASYTTTAHFTSQLRSFFCLPLLWFVAPPVGLARWSAALLVSVGLYYLSIESFYTIEVLAGNRGGDLKRTDERSCDEGSRCPPWMYSAKQIEDSVRHAVAALIHHLITEKIIWLSSLIAPHGQKYWTYPGPTMDLGPGCDYGMAYQINGSPQKKPGVFQCNVGYIGYDVTDYAQTASSTKKMMEGLLSDPEAGNNGFVTDVVAHFMLPPDSFAKRFGKYHIREINLSAWEDDKAAMNWYRRSDVHKELVKQYYGGGLASFSAMLASLRPDPQRPIRWDVRCRNCRYLVQGPDPVTCPHCSAPMFPLPYF